jgi:pilus assembly protein CpaB
MTRRRLITIAAAVLLTLFGTVVILAYVNSAEQRAQQGQELTTVLVPIEEIEAGVPAAQLAERVTTEEIPAELRPEDAVSRLDELDDQVAAVALLPGEPLRASRFQEPGQARGGQAAIPEGLQVVSVALEPQRALGGRVQAGQTVGVMLSMDQAEIPSPDNPGESVLAESATGMVLNRVPVIEVSGVDPETSEASSSIMVSLALDESDAERLIFGAEQGRIWLTQQTDDAPALQDQFRTRQNVLTDVDTEGRAQ